jgi:hypothetical protein
MRLDDIVGGGWDRPWLWMTGHGPHYVLFLFLRQGLSHPAEELLTFDRAARLSPL